MATTATPIEAAIKAVKADAKKTEYERGYYNGLIAGQYLTGEDATLEGLANVSGFITEHSAEVDANKADFESGIKSAVEAAMAEVNKELEAMENAFTAYKESSVDMDTHKALLEDLSKKLTEKDAQIVRLTETANIALREPVSGGKYHVGYDAGNLEKPYSVLTAAGKVIARYRTENDALVASKQLG